MNTSFKNITLILIIIGLISVIVQIYQYYTRPTIQFDHSYLYTDHNCITPDGFLNQACENRYKASKTTDPVEAKKILCQTPEVRAAFQQLNKPCEE